MAQSFELNANAVLNDFDLYAVRPTGFVVWVYAIASATERNSDVPDWERVRTGLRRSRSTLNKALGALIAHNLVTADPPHALLRRGELWRASRDRPGQAEWTAIRTRIFERDNYTCRYCGDRGGKLECDHVVPVSKGGTHFDANLVTACFACNRSKRDKLIQDWRPDLWLAFAH